MNGIFLDSLKTLKPHQITFSIWSGLIASGLSILYFTVVNEQNGCYDEKE